MPPVCSGRSSATCSEPFTCRSSLPNPIKKRKIQMPKNCCKGMLKVCGQSHLTGGFGPFFFVEGLLLFRIFLFAFLLPCSFWEHLPSPSFPAGFVRRKTLLRRLMPSSASLSCLGPPVMSFLPPKSRMEGGRAVTSHKKRPYEKGEEPYRLLPFLICPLLRQAFFSRSSNTKGSPCRRRCVCPASFFNIPAGIEKSSIVLAPLSAAPFPLRTALLPPVCPQGRQAA